MPLRSCMSKSEDGVWRDVLPVRLLNEALNGAQDDDKNIYDIWVIL